MPSRKESGRQHYCNIQKPQLNRNTNLEGLESILKFFLLRQVAADIKDALML